MYKSLDVHSYKFPYDNVQREEQETDGVQKLLRGEIILTSKNEYETVVFIYFERKWFRLFDLVGSCWYIIFYRNYICIFLHWMYLIIMNDVSFLSWYAYYSRWLEWILMDNDATTNILEDDFQEYNPHTNNDDAM